MLDIKAEPTPGNYKLTYTNAALAVVINLIIVGALYYTIKRRMAALVIQGKN